MQNELYTEISSQGKQRFDFCRGYLFFAYVAGKVSVLLCCVIKSPIAPFAAGGGGCVHNRLLKSCLSALVPSPNDLPSN